MTPASAAAFHIERSTILFFSHSSKWGATSFSRNAATVLRKSSWSAVYRLRFIALSWVW